MTVSGLSIDQAIAVEAALLKDFVRLLETEQAHLIAGETDPLLGLSEQKTRFADQLNDASERREALVDAKSTDLKAYPGWSEILRLAEQAKNINALNGKLIGQRLANNQQALQVLMSATERSSIYGPDGQPRHGGGGRTLGKA